MNAASVSQAAPGARIYRTIMEEAATGTISIRPLRANFSVIEGSGGNIGVFTGSEGTLLVDAGIEVSRQKIVDALASIGAGPIGKLINTHWHFDHTGGNNWVHSSGATIVAHENTFRHLSTATRVEGWRTTFPPLPSGALPSVVFNQDCSVDFNGATILLEHYAAAHTDADISVSFPHADILFVGDTWWNGVYPFIDYSNAGSIDGTIRACDTNLARAGDQTLIVPGHGPAGDKTQLAAFRDMLIANRAKIAALKKRGHTVDEVIALKPTAEYDAQWGSMVEPALFVEVVYAGV